MRWTNMSEKNIIKAWAKEEHDFDMTEKCLPQPDARAESYWQRCDGSADIVEYGFETIPELVKQLSEVMPDERYQDILLPLAVAAFKGKKDLDIVGHAAGDGRTDAEDKKDDEFKIPEFVYVF